MTRRHVATIIGIAPADPPPGAIRRRATDLLAAPRVLVYTDGEDRVDVIVEGDVVLDANSARELAGALLAAGNYVDPAIDAPANSDVDR